MRVICVLLLLACAVVRADVPEKMRSPDPFSKSSERFRKLVAKHLPEYKDRIDGIFRDKRFCLDTLIIFIREGKRKMNFDSLLFCKESISRGVAFYRSRSACLDSIQARYHIPKSRLVGLYRVEVDLGKFPGEHNAVCAYATLFRIATSPKAKRAYAGQFSALLRYCFENNIDPFTVRSSWAGAVALCQFMPVNLHLAVDGDGDGVADIFQNEADALHSIANFLSHNGWNPRKEFQSIRKYNPGSSAYPKWVIGYADSIEMRIKKSPP